jgi:hypothetical protein
MTDATRPRTWMTPAWRREWLSGQGSRFAVRGHMLYPSRYARNLRTPSHWACALCTAEFSMRRFVTWLVTPWCCA